MYIYLYICIYMNVDQDAAKFCQMSAMVSMMSGPGGGGMAPFPGTYKYICMYITVHLFIYIYI
jgi:hypothetical protein